MKVEIERKFLVKLGKNIPKSIGTLSIAQTYLMTGETEIRIRKVLRNTLRESEFYLGIKNGKGLTRKEIEIPISREIFYDISKGYPSKFITKTRTLYSHGDKTIEIDKFSNKELNGLVIAEIEFESEEEAKGYILPDWIESAVEVTEDEKYMIQKLWESVNRS